MWCNSHKKLKTYLYLPSYLPANLPTYLPDYIFPHLYLTCSHTSVLAGWLGLMENIAISAQREVGLSLAKSKVAADKNKTRVD